MMLLSFHVVVISTLVAVVSGIAFRMGKKEGIRLTEFHYEEAEELKKENLSAS